MPRLPDNASVPGTPQMSAPGTPKKSRHMRAKEKDPKEPKKPTSAYFLWYAKNRARVVEELGTTHKKTVSQRSAELWKQLPEDEVNKWKGKWAKQKEAYQKDMAAYKGSDGYAEFQASKAEVASKEASSAIPKVGEQVRQDVLPINHLDLIQVPTSEEDMPAFLAKFPASAILAELSRRLGIAPPPSDGAPAKRGISSSDGAPAKRKRKTSSGSHMRPATETRSSLSLPETATANDAADEDVPPEADEKADEEDADEDDATSDAETASNVANSTGFRCWFTDKRKRRVIDYLGKDDEQAVVEQAVSLWDSLDQVSKDKYTERATKSVGV